MLCLRSFLELSKVLEPGKAVKTDKTSTIADAIRIVTQLRAENGQLRQLNKFLEVRTLGMQFQLSMPDTCGLDRTGRLQDRSTQDS